MTSTMPSPTHASKTNVEAVLKAANDADVTFVRLWFNDIIGNVKSFEIPVGELENAIRNGMGFDGSSITGFNRIEESDMVALPDLDTFAVMPYDVADGHKVGRMICDVVVPGTHEPYEGDPRWVLRQALKRAADLGFDTVNVGPELEFFLFEDDTPALKTLDRGGYFDLTTLDAKGDVRKQAVLALERMGIDVEYSHHEVAPSQHEIDIRYNHALPMADSALTYRVVVKEVASRNGLHATFMPKPLHGENGSGMHVHMSLFKDGDNAFFDASDKHHLSATAKSFIAGVLRHAREMSIVLAQTVNSYKRLVPGFEAPVYVAWSQRNRSALVRVPFYHPGQEKATRFELRCPDPTCNPYLAFAVMVHAGLDGIEKGYELEDPMDSNLFDLTHHERKRLGISNLPGSLGEAINYAEDSEFLLEALGEHVHSRLIGLKRAEWDEYRTQVSPWELERYLPVL
ncbi:MAG: glutamine synthetase [Thermoleophilia bacterium]|nr:glutamine synthetase [Thermoleophilia bacterium]